MVMKLHSVITLLVKLTWKKCAGILLDLDTPWRSVASNRTNWRWFLAISFLMCFILEESWGTFRICVLSPVSSVKQNGSKALDHDEIRSKRRLDSSGLFFMIINYNIRVIGLELEILPFLLDLMYSQEQCL